MQLSRVQSLDGRLVMPGDKSISHRAAIFSAIADGRTQITNFATSVDCASTLACLEALGVGVERVGSTVSISGVGRSGLKASAHDLDCGNSGTTMRLLAGVLAGQNFKSVLTGDESLRSRPMMRVILPLEKMGAVISSRDGKAPLEVAGNELRGIEYETPVASAQIKSCVLLAGLFADGRTSVIERTATRDHTERMLEWFGAPLEAEALETGSRLSVEGGISLKANDFRVPGDVSSSAFFMVAAASLPGSDLVLEGVGLNPSRTAVIDVLRRFGADIEIKNERVECNELVGDISVTGGIRAGGGPHKIDGKVVANLIDEIPILAVFGTQLEGGLEVRDAAELRVKESDRIKAVVENLKGMGADIAEYEDGFKVARSELSGARVDSFGDHRIAMAFAVAALFAKGETEIIDADCAGVSFPGFFDALRSVSA